MYKYCKDCEYRSRIEAKDSCCSYFLTTGEHREHTKTDCLVFTPRGGDNSGRSYKWNHFQGRDGVL